MTLAPAQKAAWRTGWKPAPTSAREKIAVPVKTTRRRIGRKLGVRTNLVFTCKISSIYGMVCPMSIDGPKLLPVV